MNQFINYLKSNEKTANDFIHSVMKENYSNEEYWIEIIPTLNLSNVEMEKFFFNNIELFNVKYLIKYYDNLPLTIIDYLINDLDFTDLFDDLIKYQKLTLEQIEKIISTTNKNVDWSLIQEFQQLNSEFITKYENYIDWNLISENQFLTLEFLLGNKNKLNWSLIASNLQMQKIICPSFLKLFADTNIWNGIAYSENIGIDMILEDFNKYLTNESIDLILEWREDLTETQIEKLNNYRK